MQIVSLIQEESDLDINVDPPIEEEIICSIKSIERVKAGGKDRSNC